MDEMSLVDHLTDLRKGILRVLVVLILSMIVGFIGAEPILEYLKTAEPASQITWNVFSPQTQSACT